MAKPSMPNQEVLQAWADTINDWYGLNATTQEVRAAFKKAFVGREAFDGRSYISVFFRHKDGSFRTGLDTADREELADAVEILRGKEPSGYAFSLNK